MNDIEEIIKNIEVPSGLELRVLKSTVSCRIYFSYKGVKCRETISCRKIPKIETPTHKKHFASDIKKDIAYADSKRGSIIYEIQRRTFKYSNHFPDSKRCTLFGETYHDSVTVGDLLEEYLQKVDKLKERSTARNYKKAITGQLMPYFRDTPVQELKPKHIREWMYNKSLSCKRKTIVNNLIPLKQILKQAVADKVILRSPLDDIDIDQEIVKEARESEYECDPFNIQEIEQILSHMDGQVRNIFTTAFFTGMRTSELIGLTWEKVHFREGYILVDQAKVDGVMKGTKTGKKGIRKVIMLEPVVKALEDQANYTLNQDAFVFHHPTQNKPWANDKQLRMTGWMPAIKRSGVRYRNPYQTRHSYACLMIAQNENLFWLAGQLGHRGIEMLNRHYGAFIEQSGERYRPKQGFAGVTAKLF
ncbi:tyrosine-type recombinase/integrase [Endozoicomonas sp. SM1973]|uniref:Tyrosine-type recombinase/integrase n=1 Tax=Spartinivicinus marinus TaxID=2994442 RepID=A0A853IJ69_9GAMM|nr:tyrosine-type recombinase/integrase [Spartinivicinus marinus]MCX4027892.1 tyrosine-type recombinase/integrase [Spartinivicinus marinus]NYZ69447.1 tyrosine-type recombinase/integrase [Spartinivicinus marinus]